MAGLILTACGKPTPSPRHCPTPLANTACPVRDFSASVWRGGVAGSGSTRLRGASGLAWIDGQLLTVLEHDGIGPGRKGNRFPGVLFQASAKQPSKWRPMDIEVAGSCIQALTGRNDLELESIDARHTRSGIEVAVGSDDGFVAIGKLRKGLLTLDRCAVSVTSLSHNHGFEAVVLAPQVTPTDQGGGIIAFEEVAVGQGYRQQRLLADANQGTPQKTQLSAQMPKGCKPRVTASAPVGSGTALLLSCRLASREFRYFVGAVASQGGKLALTPLNNDRYGTKTPNLEGLASAGGCDDPLWMIADDRHAGGAPTVLATTPVPNALRGMLGCKP
ncbi:MAG: hypothetical protein KC502_19055 [Myxococcales bacterium]|nr:hypothetical protein [Myxococcales bacterium]